MESTDNKIKPFNLLYIIVLLSFFLFSIGLPTPSFAQSTTYTFSGYCLTSPYEMGYYDTANKAYFTAVQGNFAYVGDEEGGFRIINIINPYTPYEIATVPLAGGAYGIQVKGNYAFVCSDTAGYNIVDISDSYHPTVVGHYTSHYRTFFSAVSSNYAYIADWYSGLRIVDISNPYNPVEVGHFDTIDIAVSVTLRDKYAYIAISPSGMIIVDISNPTNPVEVGRCSTPGIAWYIALKGNYAYVADDSSGMRVIDVSNPANPMEVSYGTTQKVADGIAISENYAYVADWWYGVRIFDISNPLNPIDLGLYDSPGYPRSVLVEGDYLYLSDYYSGLRIINIKDTGKPIEGVSLAYSGYTNQTVLTDTTGYYIFTDIPSGYNVITPSKENYGFNPSFRSYSYTTTDFVNQIFLGDSLLHTPSGLVAKAVSDSQIGISWTAITANINGFGIDYKIANGEWNILAFVSASTPFFIHSGLAKGQTYCYRVYAYNDSKLSDYSGTACATPGDLYSPTNLVLTQLDTTQIRLSWVDNSYNESGFGVDYQMDTEAWQVLTFVGSNVTTLVQWNLLFGHSYTYRVYSYNASAQSPYSNTAGITLKIPAPPYNLTAVSDVSHHVLLTWNANSNTETSYRIEYSIDFGVWSDLTTVSASDTHAALSQISTGHYYCFRIYAVNGIFQSLHSNQACIAYEVPTGMKEDFWRSFP